MIEIGLAVGLGLAYVLMGIVIIILCGVIGVQMEQLSSCYKEIRTLTKERNELKWGSKNAD